MCKPRLLDFQSQAKVERLIDKVHVETEGLVERLAYGLKRTMSKRLSDTP